ncbi:MAG: TIGR04211 family SH3 domain-containing protein [Hydrogenophaga sp.]
MFRTVLLAVLIALAVAPAMGETVYVDDTLRVGVRRNANSVEAPLEVVVTGALLEVLERSGNYLRVRTPAGVEGWVGSMYVTSNPPARHLVEQLRAENAQLKSELESATSAQPSPEVSASLVEQLDSLRQQNEALQAQAADPGESGLSAWGIAAALIALFVGGFALGKRHERDRVVRRFNGLEI